jgi:C4-dicarboxylate transporter DctM subunit
MLAGCLVYSVQLVPVDTIILPQKIQAGLDSFSLLAVPFFVLLGELMTQSGATARLVSLATNLLCFVRAGVAQINILANMLMAGVSGSAVADASALGGLFIPAMVKEGYSAAFSAALTAAASTIGPIIPPSILMVIYGALGNVSVGRLFLAGAIPGILMGIYMMITTYFIMRKNKQLTRVKFSSGELISAAKSASLVLLVPLLIIGGIVGGVVTPTESGVLAVLYMLIVGKFIHRTLDGNKIAVALKNTVKVLGPLGMILGAAGVLGWILNAEQAGVKLTSFLLSISSNKIALMFLINALLFILGCFIESVAILTILTPVLVPLMEQMGWNPVLFGVVMLLNLMIGLVTPPVGLCMFVTVGIAKITIGEFLRAVWPFYVAIALVIVTICFFENLAMFLPDLLMPVR